MAASYDGKALYIVATDVPSGVSYGLYIHRPRFVHHLIRVKAALRGCEGRGVARRVEGRRGVWRRPVVVMGPMSAFKSVVIGPLLPVITVAVYLSAFKVNLDVVCVCVL